MRIFTGDRYYNVNSSVKFNIIKLINYNSVYLGIFKLSDVKKISKNLNLDIIEISINNDISLSVCKIVKKNRFQYDEFKKYNKKKKTLKLFLKKKNDKEMSFSLFISRSDYLNKISKIIKILSKNINVKVTVLSRGREVTKIRLIKELFLKIKYSLDDYGVIEDFSNFNTSLNHLYFYKLNN